MMNPITFGMAMAATATLGIAGSNGDPVKKDPLLDSLFQSNVTVKYAPGQGVTFEGDKGDFALNISGRLQAGWFYTGLENAADTNSFGVRAARVNLAGHVWNKDIQFYMQIENAGAPGVLDGWVNWDFMHNDDSYLGVIIGTGATPNGLQWSADATQANAEMSQSSIATNTFATARATGAAVHGGFAKKNDGYQFLWHAGLLNNDISGGSAAAGRLALNESHELNFTAGIQWAGEGAGMGPWSEGDLAHNGKMEPTAGANLFIGSDRVGGTEFDTFMVNVYAGAKFGNGVAAQGELWFRTDEPNGGADADSTGWYLQGSYTTAPGSGTQWGFVGRIAMVDMSDANPLLAPVGMVASGAALAGFATGDVLEIQAGVNAYYHEHKLKTQIMLTFQSVNVDTGGGADSDNLGVDLLTTLMF
jgi:hypothetical protein